MAGLPAQKAGLADPLAWAGRAYQPGKRAWQAGSGRWALQTWPTTVQAVVISVQGRMATRSAGAAGPRAGVRAARCRDGLLSPQVRKVSHAIA